MAYDNTKLDNAVAEWIHKRCEKSFGETYAGDLLASFEKFCADTGALKRSPGRVAFGKALARRRLKKRKVCGLTYWTELVLKKPPKVSVPRQNTKAEDTKRAQDRAERLAAAKKAEQEKAAARKAHKEEVRKRIQTETKETVVSAGFLEPGQLSE